VGCRGGLVGMCGEIVVFGGAVVRALRHIGSPPPLDAVRTLCLSFSKGIRFFRLGTVLP
jgi:hypothetical protein